jgi:hypothetical protein
MKTMTVLILTTCSAAFAGYDYTITDGYFWGLTIKGHETLLMTGGGGYDLTAEDYSILDIQNTAPFAFGSGGIGDVILTDSSRMNMAGGEIYSLSMKGNSTSTIHGGQINNIDSWQTVSVIGRDPVTQEFIFNRHIEMFVKDYLYNVQTKILKGTWGDDSLFNIQLIDRTQYGYSPAIDNVQFTIIPEPISLLLFAAEGKE